MPDSSPLRITFPDPSRGLVEALDPASPDYPPAASPSMENVRTAYGTVRPRDGIVLWETVPGSGRVWGLKTHQRSDGDRVRLAWRGTSPNVQLYDYVEGVDTEFQAVSGAGSLYGGIPKGVTVGDYFYFTDRDPSGTIRKYASTGLSGGGSISTVTLPSTPGAAPDARPYVFGVLENWASVGGWTESANGVFDIAGGSRSNPFDQFAGTGNKCAEITVRATSQGETIAENVTDESCPTDSLVFYARQEDTQPYVEFQVGVTQPNEAITKIRPNRSNDWKFFLRRLSAGNNVLNKKRFRCVEAPGSTTTLRISPILMPGRLQGKYRYRYAHYATATGREGALSEISQEVDLSVVGQNNRDVTDECRHKSAEVRVATDDSGATTDAIRVYRNSGQLDSLGRPVWLRCATVWDYQTTLAANVAAGGTTITVPTNTKIKPDDSGAVSGWAITVDHGTLGAETVRVIARSAGVTNDTLTIDRPLLNAHVGGVAVVRVACVDNLSDAVIDPTQTAEPERDGPPNDVRHVSYSPDGRLWLQYGKGGVAVSNRPTPDRPLDYEAFPSGVDPVTSQNPIQGWRFTVAADDPGDEIQWAGFHQGYYTVLTRRAVYRVLALSQTDWGPAAIRRVANVGCLEGETVVALGGMLCWVAEGPRVVVWDGRSEPVNISRFRCNLRLQAAPTAYWNRWHAQGHVKAEGAYYCLWYVPEGATTPTKWLDYRLEGENGGVWEPGCMYDVGGTAIPMGCAHVLTHQGDADELYAAHPTNGNIYKLDQRGVTKDDGYPVRITWWSPKAPWGPRSELVALCREVVLRAVAATDGFTIDSLSVTVVTGGSQYGEVTEQLTAFFGGTGDREHVLRVPPDQKGRWVQLRVTGSLNNGIALRTAQALGVPIREGTVR